MLSVRETPAARTEPFKAFPVAAGQNPAETSEMVLEVSDLRDLYQRVALDMAAEAFKAGRAYERAEQDRERNREHRLRAAHPAVINLSPTHRELEERRWGPGGREHFADPRPGDYPGRAL